MNLLASEAGPNVELIGVGGTLRALTRSFVGAGATRTVNEHYGDRLFLSVKGVVDGDTLTDADSLEADVKRTMIEHVRDAVLLLDGSKLEVRGLVAIAPLSQVSRVLLTDVDPQQAARSSAPAPPCRSSAATPPGANRLAAPPSASCSRTRAARAIGSALAPSATRTREQSGRTSVW